MDSYFQRIQGIISLIVSSFKKVYIFIGDPIDPIAENIIEDLKDQSNIKKYRQIIENIHEALIEEFLELKNEAAILFNATGKNLEMGDLDDEMADNA